MRPFSTSRGGRRGNVTVVVVAFLVLFFIMALTFAFYSIAEADQAKVYRDSANAGGAGGIDAGAAPEAGPVFNKALGDLIFGPAEGRDGAFNGLRGHDLARLIYGRDPSGIFPSNQPYNGIGRVTFDQIHPGLVQPTNPTGLPLQVAQNMVNYTWVRNIPGFPQALFEIDSNYFRDPNAWPPPPYDPNTYRYYAKNANYTFPDANNLFLSVLDPKQGRVIVPSFSRPWMVVNLATGNPEAPPANTSPNLNLPPVPDVNDPNPWTNAYGKLMMLRPRPVDHQFAPGQSYFSYPIPNRRPDGTWDGTYGDVVNLEGGDGRYDSVWIDLDAPVRRHRGKNYKPLFAFLILDLDGRVNLNTAGNFSPIPVPPGTPPTRWAHWSNQGIGPWEVNLAKVMPMRDPNTGAPVVYPDGIPNMTEAAELTRRPLFPKPQLAHNRYGDDGVPNWKYRPYANQPLTPNMPAYGAGAAFYAQVDFDGRFKQYPDPATNPPFPRYHDTFSGHATNVEWGPAFVGPNSMPPTATAAGPHPDSRYGNGLWIPDNNYDERFDHPSLYNPYLLRPRSRAGMDRDRAFGVEEMRYLNAKYNYADLAGSEIATLAPNSLGIRTFPPGVLNARFATTPYSADLDLPGSSPWRTAPAIDYMMQPLGPGGAYPVGSTANTLTPSSFPNPAPTGNLNPGPSSDHDGGYRALLTQLGPVDINRKLADYRQFANQPHGVNNYNPQNAIQALRDRQGLAQDIFTRLLFVTTGVKSSDLAQAASMTDSIRYLAQLAVNIVDYLDDDDYMTPFNWNPANTAAPADAQGEAIATAGAGWVFGFERPRLVINEVYGRVENDPMDPELTMPTTPGMPKASTKFVAKWWIELHNPLTPANANELGLLSDGGAALLRNPNNPQQSIYQIVFGKKTAAQQRLTLPPAAAGAGPAPAPAHDNVLGALANPADGLYKLSFAQGAAGVTQTHDRVGPNLRDANGQGFSSPQPPGAPNSPPYPAFFLVASEEELPDDTAMGTLKANWADPNLKYDVPLFAVRDGAAAVGAEDERAPRILLRRLANPHEPPGQFNPYVTVDYFRFDKAMMNDAVEYDGMGMPPNPPGTGTKTGPFMQKIPWNNHFSYGKRQPFAAPDFPDQNPPQNELDKYKQQPNPPPTTPEQIRHTFARHNARGTSWPNSPTSMPETLDLPFQPLIHQDRAALSPVELLHTVAVKPYELTQLFVRSPGTAPPPPPASPGAIDRWAFTANWLDQGLAPTQSTFLWRALDFLRTGPSLDGLAFGGRVPGRININTMFAPEIMEAVVDPPTPPAAGPDYKFAGNRFPMTDLGPAVGLLGSRMPTGQIDGNSRPFLGSAAPGDSTAPNFARDKTLLRSQAAPTPAGLWNPLAPETYQPGTAGALQKFEMLSKTHNRFTTRSNAFAVYLTVGYFEVMNDGPYTEVNRPILGKELGTDDGNIVRHKMFAVIDRTNLTVEQPAAPNAPLRQGQPPVFLAYQPAVPASPNPPTFAVANDPDLGGPAGTTAPWVPPDPNPAAPPEFRVPGIVVRIPAVSQMPPNPPPSPPNPPTPTQSVSGYYDGTLWTLIDGSLIDLDIGGRQERVIVQLPPNAFDAASGTAQIIIRPTQAGNPVYPNFRSNHQRGAAMRLVAPDPAQAPSALGNPGPQPAFQYTSPRYGPVVKYAERLR